VYLHGIIESRFSERDDVFADMETMRDQYPLGSFLSWQRYHGIGHGAMYYTDNDLSRSPEMCGAFGGSFARSQLFERGVHGEPFHRPEAPSLEIPEGGRAFLSLRGAGEPPQGELLFVRSDLLS